MHLAVGTKGCNACDDSQIHSSATVEWFHLTDPPSESDGAIFVRTGNKFHMAAPKKPKDSHSLGTHTVAFMVA